MLAALFVILFLGGSTSAFLDYIDDSRDAVRSVVVEDERRKETLDILGTMSKRSKDHNKQVRTIIEELSGELEGRDDNSEEVTLIGDRHFDTVEEYNKDILDLRFELKEHVTREEWAQIFPEV